ncbi:MAG: transposase, partial [Planctomycetota bacterium]|nr:transposase [Planctomycetota bacterium]
MEVWRTRDQYGETELEQKRAEFRSRVSAIIAGTWTDSHSLRLVKRLRNYENYLFTFLEREGIPFDNNHGERLIRPAVILRKNSYGNRSEQGADCQAVLMSIFRTLRQ